MNMVVTTKQTKPVIPAVSSRSSSNTAIPKAAKRASLNVKPATSIPARPLQDSQLGTPVPPVTRTPAAPLITNVRHDATGPFADDVKFLASPKKISRRLVKRAPAKRPSKVRKRKKARPWSELIQLLTTITFILFSIYSLLVCPRDAQLQSPVCRGLEHYRRIIVDPYILPPLRAAVTHPAVAPHIERAKPYVDHAVEVAKNQYHIAHDKVFIASQPYIVMAKREYKVRLRPHVRLMEYNLRRYQRRAQPYINLFKAKAVQSWFQLQVKAEPYITPLLLKLEQVPIFVKTFIQKPLEDGKEKWVDPQVKKIVDKMHEMSAAAASGGVEEAVEPGTGKAVAPEKVVTAEPVAAETYYSTPSPEATTAHASDPEPTIDPLDIPVRNPNYHEDVEDLEFFEDLEKWLNESTLTEERTRTTSTPPAPTHFTPEEKEERHRREKEETARKRKDVIARHDKWEHDLEALIDSEHNKLIEFLGTVRNKAAKELASRPIIQEQITKMRKELDESFKYSKLTLDKLKEEWKDRHGETDQDGSDKVHRWTGILENIEGKFARRREAVNKEIAEWVPKWMAEESEAIRKASEEVAKFADKAQADLIGDYAWLLDVTYRDWERYHELMSRSHEAKERFHLLTEPRSTSVLSNPVLDHLYNLKLEIIQLQEDYDEGVEKIRKTGWKYILGDAFDEHAYRRNDHIHVPKPQEPYNPELDMEDFGGHPFIGKSKEQVEQAAAALRHDHDHEEL